MMLDIVKDVKVIKAVIPPFDRLDVDTPVDAQVDAQVDVQVDVQVDAQVEAQVKHLETQVPLFCSTPINRQVFQRN